CAGADRVDAAGTEVALGGDLVRTDLVGILLRVGLAAVQSLLLVGEGHHADAACRRLRQVADQLAGGHGDADARGIVHRPGAEVPRIQVSTDEYHFTGLAAAGDFADHVVGSRFSVPAAIQHHAH